MKELRFGAGGEGWFAFYRPALVQIALEIRWIGGGWWFRLVSLVTIGSGDESFEAGGR